MPKVETARAKIVDRLSKEGWDKVRAGGDHDVYRHPTKPGTAIVPRHRTISPGVARVIAKVAGWL